LDTLYEIGGWLALVAHPLCHTHGPGLGNALGSKIVKKRPQPRSLHALASLAYCLFADAGAPAVLAPVPLAVMLADAGAPAVLAVAPLAVLLMLLPPQSLRSLVIRLWAPSAPAGVISAPVECTAVCARNAGIWESCPRGHCWDVELMSSVSLSSVSQVGRQQACAVLQHAHLPPRYP
jgi:hypothetical protein